jgi:hypothetical protein
MQKADLTHLDILPMYVEGLSAELILRPVSPRASTLSVEVCMQPVVKSMGQVNLFQSIVMHIVCQCWVLRAYH